jgi:hypothetical protein
MKQQQMNVLALSDIKTDCVCAIEIFEMTVHIKVGIYNESKSKKEDECPNLFKWVFAAW